ncbi:hypothetical protein WJX77_011622 [Trebouxia sp. C0004]
MRWVLSPECALKNGAFAVKHIKIVPLHLQSPSCQSSIAVLVGHQPLQGPVIHFHRKVSTVQDVRQRTVWSRQHWCRHQGLPKSLKGVLTLISPLERVNYNFPIATLQFLAAGASTCLDAATGMVGTGTGGQGFHGKQMPISHPLPSITMQTPHLDAYPGLVKGLSFFWLVLCDPIKGLSIGLFIQTRWPWQRERSSRWALLFPLWASVDIASGILHFPGSGSHLVWRERSSVPWSALHGTRSCGIYALLLPGPAASERNWRCLGLPEIMQPLLHCLGLLDRC